jgi:putative DNA primase/helicase
MSYETIEQARQRLAGKQFQSKNAPDSALESVCASKIVMAGIDWLWPDRFALGKLGLLVGLPDEGKGQIFAYMAAQVTRGSEWPCGEGKAIKGKVVMMGAEDDDSDTVVPRLVAAGADLGSIEIVHMVRDAGDKKRMFSLVTDLAMMRQKIKDVGDVKLVLIDPISAYLGIGKVDSFRTTDVRAVLAPLVELAADLKVAVIGIMHFNKKVDVTNALLRISDSLAFGATARHVFAVVDDAENKRKLMVRGKNNLATHNLPALAYYFGTHTVGTDPNTKKPISAPYVLWHPKHVDVTASEAMQASKSPAARDEAKKFLADLLAAGPMSRKDIDEAAEG